MAVLLWLKFCAILRIAVKHQSNEEDDEEMMRVPEHLKVWPADDLHRWSDDEDEC